MSSTIVRAEYAVEESRPMTCCTSGSCRGRSAAAWVNVRVRSRTHAATSSVARWAMPASTASCTSCRYAVP